MKNILFLSFLLFLACNAAAQSTMMPIPFYKKGEDRRMLTEEDPCYRVIETKIKNAFLEEADYELIDYLITLNNLDATDARTSPGKYDIVTLLVQAANPDIYIIADIENAAKKGTSGRQEYAMTINLTAHWTHDGKFLGGTILNSGWRFYDDCFALVEKTFQNKNEEGERKSNVFVKRVTDKLNSLNPTNESIKVPHQSVSIEFFLDQNTSYNFFSRLSNGEMLFKTISKWIKENTVDKKADSNYDRNYVKFQEVRIPVSDPDTQEAYSPSDFTVEFLDYFSQLSFQDAPEKKLEFNPTGTGNAITFTLL